jgi:ankyrin repeat protein
LDEINIFSIVRHGKLDLYKKHIDDFDINIRKKDGQSLLHKAVAHSQYEIALDLIERSIDINLQDRKQQTVLHY